MRQSTFFAPTLKDNPHDAEIKSHQLLMRAGYMRQNASGIYSYLPLGYIVLRKLEAIVREEMNKAGAQELLMPAIQPAELWHETGRWELYGPELMRLRDRHDRDFALGATHEELITSLIRDVINSYRKMPAVLYQIQTKYRDEQRPRFGLLRGREFLMKDAYSFDTTEEGLDKIYRVMFDTYMKIFARLQLNFRPVVADSGAIGGDTTHEFMALSEVGEDTIAYSTESDYAANVEMAPVVATYEQKNANAENAPEMESVQIAQETSNDKQAIECTVLKVAEDEYVLILTRGDHTINDVKVKHFFQTEYADICSNHEVAEALQIDVDDVSPFSKRLKVYADHAIKSINDGVFFLEHKQKKVIHIHPNRDLDIVSYADFRMIEAGDPSPDGHGVIELAKGIEIGQVFKLGTHYSEAMNAQFLDENGKKQPIIMGCYGIGISRTLAAVVEQHNDDDGIIWPVNLAPFAVHLIPINIKNKEQHELAERLYAIFQAEGIDVLFDDRHERPGVKFADSDLIGVPLRIIIGKKANEEIVELKVRKTGESLEVPITNVIEMIDQKLKELQR